MTISSEGRQAADASSASKDYAAGVAQHADAPLLRNPAKATLESGGVVSCMSVKLLRSADAARLAYAAGFDAIYIDMEHGVFDLSQVSQICLTAYDIGLTALVRCGVDHVSQVADAGAMGVIVPHVGTAEQAREVVGLAKFPPEGIRGSVNRLPQMNFQMVAANRLHPAANAAMLVAVMIESKEALDNIDAIAGVNGVDMLFVGANDLSADLGIAGDYEHPAMVQALDTVLNAARVGKKSVGLGGLGSRPDLLKKYVDEGASFVSVGADLSLFADAARASVQQFKLSILGSPD